jgi:hypothetical protein
MVWRTLWQHSQVYITGPIRSLIWITTRLYCSPLHYSLKRSVTQPLPGLPHLAYQVTSIHCYRILLFYTWLHSLKISVTPLQGLPHLVYQVTSIHSYRILLFYTWLHSLKSSVTPLQGLPLWAYQVTKLLEGSFCSELDYIVWRTLWHHSQVYLTGPIRSLVYIPTGLYCPGLDYIVWRVGWVDIGIRTTLRLGKVLFVGKVCKICLKTFLVHWLLPHRCTLLGPCSTCRSNMVFSQYRVYGYQKTQNFT